MLTFQVNKCNQEVTIEGMLDSLQLGWSTVLSSIVDHFLSSLLKTRSGRADSGASLLDPQNQLSGIVEAETKVLNLVPGPSSTRTQFAFNTESSELREKLRKLLKNSEANVQCTNINVYTCHEQTGQLVKIRE